MDSRGNTGNVNIVVADLFFFFSQIGLVNIPGNSQALAISSLA
ncbi:Uncharacterised protein [Escherichia coli]|nr:Uncharacterised protein [Escherichia coli]